MGYRCGGGQRRKYAKIRGKNAGVGERVSRVWWMEFEAG